MATKQAQQEGREAPEGATDKAQAVASQAGEQVREKAGEVRGQISGRLRDQLDTQSTALGERIGPVSAALRKAAEHLRGEDNHPGAKAAEAAADRAEKVAGYLRDGNSDRFLGDVERFGRQRPWAAGALGAAVGFVLSRFLKASAERRYATARHSELDASLPLSRDEHATPALPPVERSGPRSW